MYWLAAIVFVLLVGWAAGSHLHAQDLRRELTSLNAEIKYWRGQFDRARTQLNELKERLAAAPSSGPRRGTEGPSTGKAEDGAAAG